jgi:cobalt-zinc-cadmium efflux system outer membrane protein
VSSAAARAVVLQARLGLAQARNHDAYAWKQLAAAVGHPGLPPADLVGRLDAPIPLLRYEKVLAQVLGNHTDVLAAQLRVQRAREVLERAGAIPLPAGDRKAGPVLEAEADLVRATEEEYRVRSELTNRLADAFAHYESNRRTVELCRNQILPEQVRVYRRVYRSHQEEAGRVTIADLLNARQALDAATTASNAALGEAWSAITDVAALLQTEELSADGKGWPVAPDGSRVDR